MKSGQPPPYLVQLDGVRAIAIACVFLTHLTTPWPRFHDLLPWGDFGVRCFFVLSGFLITGILLSARARACAGEQSLGRAARHFYARRALRIFPLFYAALAAATLLDLPGAREELPWHATYLSNYFLSIHRRWAVTSLGHFWTLAVEEQFYALWPWLILLLPRRLLPKLLVLLIAVGPMVRLALLLAGLDETGAQRFTPSCFDSLALGGLLALCDAGRAGPRRDALVRASALAGLALGVVWKATRGSLLAAVLLPLASSLVSAGLVAEAARGLGGIAGRALSLRPVVYIGKISYGLYVVHLPILYGVLPLLERRLGDPLAGRPGARVLVALAASFAVASASWLLLERPLIRLKRYFD